MKLERQSKTFIVITFLLGLYFCFIGSFPIEIKIFPMGKEMQAQIHKKSKVPPFKDIDITVYNLNQAILTSIRGYIRGDIPEYRTELEDSRGYRFSITSYYDGFTKYENKKLQKQINASIKNKTEFTKSIRQVFYMEFGIVCILLSLMFVIINKKIKNDTKQQSQSSPSQYRRPKETREEFKSPKAFPKTYQQTQHPESEEEKYKNINDSIIK